MSAESDLYTALAADANLHAVCADRIYPNALKEATQASPTGNLPAVVYTRISTPRLQAITGAVVASAPRFQLDCYATTHAGAVALMAALRTALKAMTFCKALNFVDEAGTREADTGLHRQRIDCEVVHDGE